MDIADSRKASLPIILEHETTQHLTQHRELAHWHDAVEVVNVVSGHMVCQTNQHAFELGKGDLCFINRQQLHRLISNGEVDGAGRTLVMGTSLLVQAPQINEAYVQSVLNDATFSHILLPAHKEGAARIREYIDDIELLLQEQPTAWELEVVARCHQIFRQLYCTLVDQGQSAGIIDSNVAVMRQLISYIRQHFGEDIQLEDIAAAGAVSKSTCTRLFKRYTGLSPIAYLNDYRLEMSASMLRNSSNSIAHISQACGFAQQSYFTRVFQRSYHLTPMAYRKQNASV